VYFQETIYYRNICNIKHNDEMSEKTDCELIVLEDLNWRIEKLKLEEENTRKLIKARPRFLFLMYVENM